MTEQKLTITCGKCGSDQFSHPDNPQPDDIVTCADCGASSRFDELQAAAREQAMKLIKDQLGDLFRKR